ncbi:excalibur calcium-binding domain-containing protein [Mycobacteroides saopaulense]
MRELQRGPWWTANTTSPKGAPGYSAKLDRDGDGIACEG